MDKKEDKGLEKAKSYCLRLLSVSARTESELYTRLKDKGYSPGVREEAVEALKQKGLIDDLDFARQWIDSRLRSKATSTFALKSELKRKGIKAEVIEEVFFEKESDLDDKALAKRLVKDRIERERLTLDTKTKAKLFRFLVSKGFYPDVAREALNIESDF